MKTFHERFRDHIDGSDGTVVIRESDYVEIQREARKQGMTDAYDMIRAANMSCDSDLQTKISLIRQIHTHIQQL
jgi:hypothetical protein